MGGGALWFALLLSQAEPSPSEPVAVVAYFHHSDLQTLLDAIRESGMPRGTPVYVGTYGINGDLAGRIQAAGLRYAPILKPGLDTFTARGLTPEELAKLPPGDAAYAGPVPRLLGLSPEERTRWGLEQGRRVRDYIRRAERAGTRVDMWQLDEIWPSTSKPDEIGVALRQFYTGFLKGLTYGRPQLGDARRPGFVYTAKTWRIAGLPATPDARRFIAALDDASVRLLGEEYPAFDGDPEAAARRSSRAQLTLRSRGGAWGRLGRKYVPLLTAGYRPSIHLGGNVHDWSDDRVDRWRDAFIRARLRLPVSGLGMYSLAYENRRPRVIRGAVDGLAGGLRLLRGRERRLQGMARMLATGGRGGLLTADTDALGVPEDDELLRWFEVARDAPLDEDSASAYRRVSELWRLADRSPLRVPRVVLPVEDDPAPAPHRGVVDRIGEFDD